MIITVSRPIPQTVEVQTSAFSVTPAITASMPKTGEVSLIGIPGPPGPPGPAGESLTFLEYIYNASAPPPTGSQLRMNTPTQTAVTSVYVTKNTSLGLDPSAIIRLLDASQRIVIQDKNDSTKYQRYNVTGVPTEFSTYFQIPVLWTSGGSALPEGSVKLAVIVTGPKQIHVGPTPPSSPAVNDLWVDTT